MGKHFSMELPLLFSTIVSSSLTVHPVGIVKCGGLRGARALTLKHYSCQARGKISCLKTEKDNSQFKSESINTAHLDRFVERRHLLGQPRVLLHPAGQHLAAVGQENGEVLAETDLLDLLPVQRFEFL